VEHLTFATFKLNFSYEMPRLSIIIYVLNNMLNFI
jgi:hypothetical protein